MDSRAAALLAAQGGVVGAGQLARLGLTSATTRRWVESGELVRVRRGAFVAAGQWYGAHADPDEQCRLMVMAVMRSRPTGEVATHHSALALHRLPLWHVDRRLVVLAADVQETTTCHGLRLSPLRALVQETDVNGLGALCIPDAVVTASSHAVEAGVVAADAALHNGLCTLDELWESADRLLPGLRGKARVHRALASVDGAAESPGESRSRLVLTALGLPVRSQVSISDESGAFVARVDFLVAGRVVVEFDGAVKYGGDPGQQALVAEKLREDRLRELGYELVRVTWDELAEPERLLARIRRALVRSAI
jgi:very-short-patch-repair endonuclease